MDHYDKNIHPAIFWSLICFFSVSVVFFVFIRYGGERVRVDRGQSSVYSGEAIVAFDFGNGKERKFKGPIAGSENVWNLLQQAIATGGIDVKVSDNYVPQSIDGYESGDNGKEWNLYLNNAKLELAPFKIKAAPGDSVVFKFE